MIRTALAVVVMFGVGAAGAYAVRQAQSPPEGPAVGTGSAPGFELIQTDGAPLALDDLRGMVVLLSFAFTRCGDICPVAISKLTWIQDEFGAAFGDDVHFVTVTVDPGHDAPEVLANYADQIGADPRGWSFLTGTEGQIRRVARSYGVYAASAKKGLVDHILLTSLIDRDGVIRMQYLGEHFDAEEMLGDLRVLIAGSELSG
jgi:protein SCO1/2